MDSLASICPRYHYAVELIGARWSGAILRAVMEGRHRYAEIKAVIPGVSDTMLSQRLRWLQAEGVLERHVHDTSPVRVEYALTPKGAALAPVVEALKTWAHAWVPADSKDTECPPSESSSPAPVPAV
jgi:DNA-binding HxlR family transcriptional regulator